MCVGWCFGTSLSYFKCFRTNVQLNNIIKNYNFCSVIDLEHIWPVLIASIDKLNLLPPAQKRSSKVFATQNRTNRIYGNPIHTTKMRCWFLNNHSLSHKQNRSFYKFNWRYLFETPSHLQNTCQSWLKCFSETSL